MPVHLVARRDGAYCERGVAIAAGAAGPDAAAGEFAWDDRPADARVAALAAARFPAGGDYVSEINPAAEALVAAIGRRVAAGALLLIDYGFPAAEYYHPQRSAGTLMCHYRHRAHADPFLWPGLTDITAHVDFTAIATAGVRAGLLGRRATRRRRRSCWAAACSTRWRRSARPSRSPTSRRRRRCRSSSRPPRWASSSRCWRSPKTDGIAWPGFALGDRSHRL